MLFYRGVSIELMKVYCIILMFMVYILDMEVFILSKYYYQTVVIVRYRPLSPLPRQDYFKLLY